MSSPLLALVAIIYLLVGYDYICSRQYGMALAFFAYAVSNIGFILANLGR